MNLEHISKSYHGQCVLQDVSFSLPCGVTCLMAPSGMGKTTLLRILLGLESPDLGRLVGFEGVRCSAMFQEPRLLSHLDALGNLRFALGKSFQIITATNMLKTLGLGNDLDKKISAYSGGMAGRLSLARALLAPFDLLILDEPFAGLDSENHRIALALVAQVATKHPVLLVSHDSNDAIALNAHLVNF